MKSNINKLFRFILCLSISISVSIAFMFVMLIPGLVGSYFNSESLELFLGLLVGLAFFCYLALNLYWIFNEEVRGMFLVHISKIIFALLVVIGTIFTAGIGLLFTFPALVFIGYLLYWHSQKYKEYQDKIKKNEEDQEKSENIMNMKNKLKNTKDIKRGLKKNWTDSRIKDEKVSNPVLIEVITVAIAKL